MVWRVLGTGSTVVAVAVADRGLRVAWRGVTGNEPPLVPEDPDTRWGEALAWAMLSGALIGVARLVAARRAAAYYKQSTGELPKALRQLA
jgi:hypothetical protein